MQHKVPDGLDRKETEVYRQLDPERLPKHIAIIMDGNGRWAKRRHMPRVAGHRAGVAAVRSTVETAARIGIHALTLYAFSEENWKKRPKSEVDFLMRLLSRYLKAEVPTLNKNNIRLEYIGRQHELPEDVQERMAWARRSTEQNTGTVLTLALNYSARSELVDAFRSMVNAASQNGGLEHLRIDEDTVGRHLYTSHLPDPDLVVRTSGEMRLSNFLLWQLAYAEIYVTPTLWPDFRGLHLLEGIAEYQKRERRYGGLNHGADHSRVDHSRIDHSHSVHAGAARTKVVDEEAGPEPNLDVDSEFHKADSEFHESEFHDSELHDSELHDSELHDSELHKKEKPHHSQNHASRVTRKR